MTRDRKDIVLYGKQTLLIVLSAVFFMVQSLFNYDIASHETSYRAILSVTQEPGLTKGKITGQQPDKKTKKHTRLNKRFFPETVPNIQPLVIEAPMMHYFVQHNVPQCCTIVPTPLFLIQELRGPPVIA